MKPISFILIFFIFHFTFINFNPQKKKKIRPSDALVEEVHKVNISQEGRWVKGSELKYYSKSKDSSFTIPQKIVDPER